MWCRICNTETTESVCPVCGTPRLIVFDEAHKAAATVHLLILILVWEMSR